MKQGVDFDVLRGDVDHQGYDLVVEANGVVRHIQLKAMVKGGKRAHVTINTKLGAKPSGCVVWMTYDPETFAVGPFAWFGGDPGEPLGELGTAPARHTRANAQGVKAERPDHRVVRAPAFETVTDIEALVEKLFGGGDLDHATLLRNHLRERAGDYARTVVTSLCPGRLHWENSVELAHVIEGYTLVERARLGDPFSFGEPRIEEARQTGRWPGDLLELWVTLFLEHRRWRMSAPFAPDDATAALLDGLCSQLHGALIEAGYIH